MRIVDELDVLGPVDCNVAGRSFIQEGRKDRNLRKIKNTSQISNKPSTSGISQIT